jgi:REP element-mobilizing transposase RayT
MVLVTPGSYPQRRSVRAPAYDYATPGAYYITVVTENRVCLFGAVQDDRFVADPAGAVVARIWHELPGRFPSLDLDRFVVMPNHVHGVLWLTETSVAQRVSLSAAVGAFKSLAAREINALIGRTGSVWQRGYYERVVRNEAELTAIRRYIDQNPPRWALDAENPDR